MSLKGIQIVYHVYTYINTVNISILLKTYNDKYDLKQNINKDS